MTTPKILLGIADIAVPLGFILSIVGLALKGKWKWTAAAGVILFLVSVIIVLLCPICISCTGTGSNGSGWEGTCCARSWKPTKKVPWWDLVTEPWLWK